MNPQLWLVKGEPPMSCTAIALNKVVLINRNRYEKTLLFCKGTFFKKRI